MNQSASGSTASQSIAWRRTALPRRSSVVTAPVSRAAAQQRRRALPEPWHDVETAEVKHLCIGIGHDLLRLHERVRADDVNGNPFPLRIDQKHAHRGLLSRCPAEPAGIDARGRGDTDDEIACFVGAQHPNRRDIDAEPCKIHGDPSRRARNRQPYPVDQPRRPRGNPAGQWPGENIEDMNPSADHLSHGRLRSCRSRAAGSGCVCLAR